MLLILHVLTGCLIFLFFFFFKQKTAYEMRISDWSSDVCSSDLGEPPILRVYTRLLDAAARPQTNEPEDLDKSIYDTMGALGRLSDEVAKEIGRASCRERVCQYV